MCPALDTPAPSLPTIEELRADVLPILPDAAGRAVDDLQSRLIRLGMLSPEEATGVLDPTTAKAVAEFQLQRGLRPDGVCDHETWTAVVEAGFSLGDRRLYRRVPMFQGDDVAELQRRLSALGFDAGGVDGIFGDRTTEALREFQRNVGLAPDGICGHLTITELHRLTVRRGASDLVSSVRERLVAESKGSTLAGRQVAVGEQGGFATGVAAVCRALSAAGAESLSLHHPDESEQAAAANTASVDCYIGLRLEPEHSSVKTMYYRGYRYESQTSKLLAELMSREIASRFGFDGGSAEGMAIRILRETQMPAVVLELGNPKLVVMRVSDLAQVVVTCLEQWVMVDWAALTSSTP
jgi:N-acetylmuramoyl-L-alanine amidase